MLETSAADDSNTPALDALLASLDHAGVNAETQSREGSRRPRLELVAAALAAGVFLVYIAHALALVLYPWDWSPDDGLALDYARRVLDAPATLYPRGTTVPFPAAWGPLLPVVLVPAVTGGAPMARARLIALVWTALMAAAVYALVRRRARPPLALAASALSLAPMGLTFWYMLLRVDGLMVALWAWSMVILLPASLSAGAGRLSWRRALAGAALLVAAALSKPTALVHGAPLALAWLLVDRGSALRLWMAIAGIAGASVVALDVATSGGFLFAQRLWGTHALAPAQAMIILNEFATKGAGLLLAFAAVLVLIPGRVRGAGRDAALPVLVGGLLAVPGLLKWGAWHNYLLPLACGLSVLAGRWLGAWAETGDAAAARRRSAWAALGLAGAAAITALTATFPLPSRGDEEQSRWFYEAVRSVGAPILAFRPEYAYYVVGQVVETEASGFQFLLAANVRGPDLVLRRIAVRHYRAITYFPELWPGVPSVIEHMHEHYVPWRQFQLAYFYGRRPCVILVPKGSVPPGSAELAGEGAAAAAR
jgi:hypothetical protein